MVWMGYVFGAIALLIIGLILIMAVGHIFIGSDHVKAGMLLGDEFDRNQ